MVPQLIDDLNIEKYFQYFLMASYITEIGTWKDDFIKLDRLRNRYEVGLSSVITRNDDFKSSYVTSKRSQKEEQGKLLKKIEIFKNELELIQQRLHDFSHASVGADGLQTLLENFEEKIAGYKKKMREEYGALVEEQRIYTTDIDNMMKRIDEWDESDKSKKEMLEQSRLEELKKKRKSLAEKQDKEIARQAEIGQIEKDLVLIGGRTGGWDNTDHDIFLRVWTQTITKFPPTSSQKGSLLKRVCPLLPGKIAEEVEEHIQFYSTFLELMERKKRSLKAWQEERNKHRQKIDDEGRHMAEELGMEGITGVGIGMNGKSSTTPSSPAARLEKKRQIAAWKADKKAKEDAEKALKKKEEKAKRQSDIEARKEYKKRTTVKVEAWKREEAAAKERVEAANMAVNQPTIINPMEMARRKARDDEFIAKQAEMRKAAKDRLTARERAQIQLHKQSEFRPDAPVTRDTERLLAATTAYEAYSISAEERVEREEQRNRTGAHESTVFSSGRDLAFGGRAKAGWMKGGF